MLKKRLGIEAIETKWTNRFGTVIDYFKIPSTLIIPEGCVGIGDWAFDCSWGLRKVIISESVKRIGESAFRGCRDLIEAIIPESVDWIEDEALCHCYNATIILKKPEREFKRVGVDAFGWSKNVKEEVGA